MKVVITLATRGRPEQLIDTVKRSTPNLALPNTAFILQVDEDDKDTIDALGKAELDKRVSVNIKPREDTIAAKWNRALNEEADVYLVAADDDPYITPGYDAKVLDAARLFPDGIGMVYGHLANASFTCAVSCTKGWTEKLGYIFPEYFPYWFVDHWTDDLVKITGRVSFADIWTDQSKVGKTQELREPGWWATWFDAGYMIRRSIAYQIIDDLDEPEWRKEMLRNQAPLIEGRSKWLNGCVRMSHDELSKWSGLDNKDERYQRVKAKAVALLPKILSTLPRHEAESYRAKLFGPLVSEAAWNHDEEQLKLYMSQLMGKKDG